MNDERLDNLIDSHLNGAMSRDERIELEERLLHSATDRARFWVLAETHVLTHEVAQQRLSQDSVDRIVEDKSRAQCGDVSSAFRKVRARHWLTAAASVFVVSAVAWLMWPGTSETGLMLASADAMVKVERQGELFMLPVGSMLCVRDVIVTEEVGIVVSYPDEETRLELAPATRLEVLNHRKGKQLRLLKGSLSAEVAPQPEESPMRLFTPGAEAVVLGTRFTLNADPANRELAVQKGAVRIKRAESADSIVVSSAERVKLDTKILELEPLPPIMPPRWQDADTLAFDFESELTWPVLRTGRLVVDPAGKGHCLASELVELVRRKRERLVLASGLRPQCVMSEKSVLSLRYWAASGIESIDVYLYVFGIERAFKVELQIPKYDQWVDWTIPLNELISSKDVPLSEATVRSISIHTSPISGPLPFYIDDVVLEHVSPLPAPLR